jgi:hypothetical protein
MPTDKPPTVRARRLKTPVGWRLDADIMDDVRRCVAKHPGAKIVDFVEDALREHLARVKRARKPAKPAGKV